VKLHLRLLLGLLCALALGTPLSAQALPAGTRVRITAPIAPGGSRYVGTVTATDSGRIRLRLDPGVGHGLRDSVVSIPRNLVQRVEVSLGRSRGHSRAEAARTGALAGLVAGVGLGLALGSGSDLNGVKNPWRTSLWLGPAVGAVGAGAGALIGQGAREQWRVAPSAPLAGLALGRNTTVSIRLGF
jgi:hypothetical protein